MMSKSFENFVAGNDRKLEIASLTDHFSTPSSRFRIRQHFENLAQQQINVTDHPRLWSTESAGQIFPNKRIRSSIPKLLTAGTFELLNLANTFSRTLKTRSYDLVWISRELIVGYPTFEKMVKKPFFYDIDDAVFLGTKIRSIGIKHLIESAAANFAGNRYLGDFCRQYSSKVFDIPTAVDVRRFMPATKNEESEQFVIGWSGTSSAFIFFKPLKSVLVEFFKIHKKATLKICSDRFPHELSDLASHIQFEFWTPENEAEQIRSFDVGIMPLENSEWVKGKCSYKMLLYASCGIPTITDAYGMNKDVLKLGRVGIGCENAAEWRDALNFMYENREFLSTAFPDCRKVILENFSLDVISKQIAAAIYSSI